LDAITGTVPIEQLAPEARKVVEGLYSPGDDPNPVEQRTAVTSRLPCNLAELQADKDDSKRS
jgi:hypothetical protein